VTTACSHVGLCVTDLERSRRFYEDVFGFRAAFDFKTDDEATARLLGLTPPIALTAVYLRIPGLLLELLDIQSAAPAPQRMRRVLNEPGLTHLSLFVDDVAAVLVAVSRCGGRVREETNIGAAVFVEDPDGQAIEVLQAGSPFSEMRRRSLDGEQA
jgi:catechol 2,3-dioxygenase-like lactoylglutathione lyase family enzyme